MSFVTWGDTLWGMGCLTVGDSTEGQHMTDIVILGGGTAGTLIAHSLLKQPGSDAWNITVIDRDDEHHYQPGYLFIPFGMIPAKRVAKPRHKFLPKQVTFLVDEARRIDREHRQIELASGATLHFDQLVIATGTTPDPTAVPGMADGALWYRSVFDFYTLAGAKALKPAIEGMKKGRIVVHVSETPIKCPVAPLEFALLAQDYMRKKGRDWEVDVIYVTPLDGAFTKPVASKTLGGLLAERGIEQVTDFQVERIDNDAKELVSYDGRRVPFDLLVTVPPNRGSDVVVHSGLGDEAGFVPVDKQTLQSEIDPDIWVVGDATNAPTSKAGSVVHFEVASFIPNLLAHMAGRRLPRRFDGHANCFIESGRGQAMLLDFNYEQEPVTGVFPVPKVGPLTLLKPSAINHASKLAFEAVYWYGLLPGRPLPFPHDMSLAGKDLPPATSAR